MVLSQERIGQIALIALQSQMESDGIKLNPKEVKRMVHNGSKALGIPAHELAEILKLIYESSFNKTMAELESISPPAKVEEKEQLPPGGFLGK